MTQAITSSIPLLQGRYRIDEKLGTGRLAVVYRAHDERLLRPVLVHLLRRELISQQPLRDRFIAEAQAGAARSHQSLPSLYDSGELAGRPYMVTEYILGPTLRELGPLAPDHALLYLRQLASAIAICQAANVPHPPITSTNVVLVAAGHVVLIENWNLSADELALDAVSYRAPERILSGGPPTPTGTVYALGLLLLEMLTGARAITGPDPRAIAKAHLTTVIPSLIRIRPLIVAPSIEQLIVRATDRDPSKRFADPAALERAIDDIRTIVGGDTNRLPTAPGTRANASERRRARAEGRPVTPTPPRRAYSIANTERNLFQSIAGGAVILLLALVIIAGAYMAVAIGLERTTTIQLPYPRSDLGLSGFALPGWLTGVADGEGEVMVVTIGDVEGLNLRDAPGTSSAIIALLPNGTRVRRIGDPQTVDNVAWVRIRVQFDNREREGWVAARFVRPA